ncbi:MAG: single-stranded DNA-binding protein [Microbacteriaceae bacterium]|nr:MAG: single-stranded DNA-binding protein [Microbacteriaceae bacterium]
MNRITLVGNATKNPEVRTTASGKRIAHFVVASDRGRGSDATDFLDVEVWGELAEQAAALRKGAFIRITGSVRTGSYESSDGSKRKTFVVNATTIKRYEHAKAAI